MRTLKQLGEWAKAQRLVVRVNYAVRRDLFVVLASHWTIDVAKVEHKDLEEALNLLKASVESRLRRKRPPMEST